MRWLFSPSFIRIGQKMWILYKWPIFERVPFFSSDFTFPFRFNNFNTWIYHYQRNKKISRFTLQRPDTRIWTTTRGRFTFRNIPVRHFSRGVVDPRIMLLCRWALVLYLEHEQQNKGMQSCRFTKFEVCIFSRKLGNRNWVFPTTSSYSYGRTVALQGMSSCP